MDKKDRIKQLTAFLNQCRKAYYVENYEIINNDAYDKLFDELDTLERECNFVMANSPTHTVGYEVVNGKLPEVKHNHLMLSLDKTKSIEALCEFIGDKKGIMMLKCDGLTVSLCYKNGLLFSAETRGNGEIGEVITHNAKTFINVPQKIDFTDELIVDGEAIITYEDFKRINKDIPDDKKYKNARNLASGSARQLDSSITAKRNVRFVTWKVVSGIDENDFIKRLEFAKSLGFEIVPYREIALTNMNRASAYAKMEANINILQEQADTMSIPIDGMVLGYSDVNYGDSLGNTLHHCRSQLAFKFKNELIETTLIGIDWTMGKTGVLTPTAMFNPVEIDGTTVSRASLHNITIMNGLELSKGDTITVYKSNEIIPQIDDNLDRSMNAIVKIPERCPICGGKTEIRKNNESEVLFCTNPECNGKLLGKLVQFCSKNAMNIDGLAEETLQKFIENGWIRTFTDIYSLIDLHGNEIKNMPSFGEKSMNKLKFSIEKSKNTTLERFIYALCIPNIGRAKSKTIAEYFKNDFQAFYFDGLFPGIEKSNKQFDWTQLKDFGDVLDEEIKLYSKYVDKHQLWWLGSILNFETSDGMIGNELEGLTFVVTGSFEKFKNRDELRDLIVRHKGMVKGSVSSNTSYLINNDVNSVSGKNQKAKELGVRIINEKEFLEMIK